MNRAQYRALDQAIRANRNGRGTPESWQLARSVGPLTTLHFNAAHGAIAPGETRPNAATWHSLHTDDKPFWVEYLRSQVRQHQRYNPARSVFADSFRNIVRHTCYMSDYLRFISRYSEKGT